MFTNISWTNYFYLVILLLLIYYIIIGLRFYSDDLKSLLSGNRKSNLSLSQTKAWDKENGNNSIAHEPVQSEFFGAGNTFSETSDDTFSEVERLIDRLKDAIAEAFEKKYVKQEFFLYLQLILKEYSKLKTPPFQSIINELIISECAKHGSVMFNEDEVVALWNEVA